MKHYGDITKISGYEVPIVDVITGGSPCQDLSVAGKRAGLAGERSGLFMEQIRIVKEMRDRDVRENGRSGFLVRPRYMVWENVPGAFTSGTPKGSDFAAVIEEIIKVCEPNASMRVCVPDGGWTKSGCFYSSDGAWSIAWRVHDAQFWGVPQRRKRISLVADFGGRTAPEILFERKGLSRDSEPCGEKREEIAGATTESFGDASRNQVGVFDSNPEHSYGQFGDVCETIRSAYGTGGGNQPIVVEPILLESNQNHATVQTDGISTALPASMGMGGGYVPMVVDPIPLEGNGSRESHMGKGYGEPGDPSFTLNSIEHHGVAMVFENHSQDSRYKQFGEICETVSAKYGTGGNNQPLVTYQDVTGTLNPGSHPGSYNGQDAYNDMLVTYSPSGFGMYREGIGTLRASGGDYGPGSENIVTAVDCRNGTESCDINASLQASASKNVNSNNVCRQGSTVRRLTPLECERLQGFPDGWTDIGEWVDSKGKKHKEADSPRYKALGNSIALPFWKWLARRICAQYERQVTMASLFDGIGGFPLAFQAAGAIPVWASEIEEFPIAVTKKHFGEE